MTANSGLDSPPFVIFFSLYCAWQRNKGKKKRDDKLRIKLHHHTFSPSKGTPRSTQRTAAALSLSLSLSLSCAVLPLVRRHVVP